MKTNHKGDAANTSFHEHVFEATPGKLRQLLGEPTVDDNGGGDKVNLEWVCETKDKQVFTIYDWKEYKRIKDNQMIEWHIGAQNKDISLKAQQEVLELLSTRPIEPKTIDLCHILEDITQDYEQADIEHPQILTKLISHNPYTPETANHKRYIKWAQLTSDLIKEPIQLEPDSPASIRPKD